jgi:hypothetical protein
MRRYVLGLLWILCSAAPSAAGAGELYTWKDEHGVVHITDDPSTIPPHYRSGSASEAPSSRTWNTLDVPTRPQQERPTKPAASPDKNAPELYDGLNEKAWRKLYADAVRHESYAKMCQNFAPGLRLGKAPSGMRIRVPANMCDLSGSSSRCISLLRDLLPDDPVSTNALSAPQMPCGEVERAMRNLLSEASRRRDRLDIRASQHGVPLEWRQRR